MIYDITIGMDYDVASFEVGPNLVTRKRTVVEN